MKTSNILIIGLLSLIFTVIVGSNLVLKAEFDKIDLRDPFSGYQKEALKPFKYVKLQGKGFGLTEIRPGDKFELALGSNRKKMDWTVTGDTLIVNYKRDWLELNNRAEDFFYSKPFLYITAPQLKGIISQNITCKVRNWNSANLMLKQTGAGMIITDNKIDSLTAQLTSGGYMKIEATNTLNNSNFQILDSSNLDIQKDVFKSFRTHVDSTARVSLPGQLLGEVNVK